MQKMCDRCGTENEEGANFCKNCGAAQSGKIAGYIKKTEFSLKRKFAVLANAISGVILALVGIFLGIILFMSDISGMESLDILLYLLAGTALALLAILLPMLTKYIGLKAAKAGKTKLHSLFDVVAEKPVKKYLYIFIDQCFSILILVALAVLYALFWSAPGINFMLYMELMLKLSNSLINIPLIIFLFRQSSNSYIGYEAGKVCVYIKDEKSET